MKVDPNLLLIGLIALNVLATLALLPWAKLGAAGRRADSDRRSASVHSADPPLPPPRTHVPSARLGGEPPVMAQAETRLAMDLERWRSRSPGGEILPRAADSCRPARADTDGDLFVPALQEDPVGAMREWHGN